MKTDLFNKKAEKVGTVELNDKVFGIKWNPDLVHQVFIAGLSNKRKNIAHTKDRSAVSGGGLKPRPQKHSGRARASSIRSPIWSGGGITFGPSNERNFKRKINKKMKRAALFSTLSKKLVDKEVQIIDEFSIPNNKTKAMATILNAFYLKGKKRESVLLVAKDKATVLAGRNIPRVKVVAPQNLVLEDLLNFKNVMFENETIQSVK